MANSIVARDLKMELWGWGGGAEVPSFLQTHLRIQTRTQGTEGTPFCVHFPMHRTHCVWNEQICLNKCIDADTHAVPKASCIMQDSLSVGLEETLIL